MPAFRLVLFWVCAASMYGQITLAPKAVRMAQGEGGPPPSASISIRSTGETEQAWTATAATDADPWLRLRVTSGSTPAALVLELAGGAERRPPGKYTGKVTIQSGGKSEAIPVEWEVRPPS